MHSITKYIHVLSIIHIRFIYIYTYSIDKDNLSISWDIYSINIVYSFTKGKYSFAKGKYSIDK